MRKPLVFGLVAIVLIVALRLGGYEEPTGERVIMAYGYYDVHIVISTIIANPINNRILGSVHQEFRRLCAIGV
jgi:hypothetical protein